MTCFFKKNVVANVAYYNSNDLITMDPIKYYLILNILDSFQMIDLFAKSSSKILFLSLFTETFIFYVNIKAMIFNANILVSYVS